MKRFLTFITAFALIAGSAIVITTGSASALSPAECKTKYDGKTYSDGQAYRDASAQAQRDGCIGTDEASSAAGCAVQVGSNGRSYTFRCSGQADSPPDVGDARDAFPGGSAAERNIGEYCLGSEADCTVRDAATENPATCTLDGCDLISNIINPIISVLTVIVGIAVVLGIMIGGFQILSAGGEAQKVASGRKHIINAVIGAVSYVLLYVFIDWLMPGGIS